MHLKEGENANFEVFWVTYAEDQIFTDKYILICI